LLYYIIVLSPKARTVHSLLSRCRSDGQLFVRRRSEKSNFHRETTTKHIILVLYNCILLVFLFFYCLLVFSTHVVILFTLYNVFNDCSLRSTLHIMNAVKSGNSVFALCVSLLISLILCPAAVFAVYHNDYYPAVVHHGHAGNKSDSNTLRLVHAVRTPILQQQQQ